MAVTIKDIAAIANVSRGTVDRALNNRAGVNPDVAKRILKIAADLGYRPNKAGKALAARKKSTVIGVMLPSIGNRFYDEVIAGIFRAQQEFADYGLKVVLKQYKGYSTQRQLQMIEELQQENINALCLVPIDHKSVRDKIGELRERQIPVLAINSDLPDSDRLCFVGNDYLKSGRTAAGLLGLMTGGKANVLLVTGSIHMLGHNQRITGFRQSTKEEFPNIQVADIVACNDDDETAYHEVLTSLRAHPQVDSLFLVAGGQQGAAQALRELGLEQKIRVVCYDDTEPNKQLLREGVVNAVICQEGLKQGYTPIHLLFDYLINAVPPSQELFYTDIVIKIKENI